MDIDIPLSAAANIFSCVLMLATLSRNMFRLDNIGACSFAIWIIYSTFTCGVFTIIWADNTDNKAPVWCDIKTHIEYGSIVAIPAASFVIIRKFSVMMRQEIRSALRKKLDLTVDLLICVGLPIIYMLFYYVVQGVRFFIVEGVGCEAAFRLSGLSFLLLEILPVVLPLASLAIYSPQIILIYLRQRKELAAGGTNSTVLVDNISVRLLLLGLLDAFTTLPYGTFEMAQLIRYLEGDERIKFWPGWNASHAEMSSIIIETREELMSSGALTRFSTIYNQWITVVYALAFFGLYGLTKRRRTWYRAVFWKVLKPFGIKPQAKTEVSDIFFTSNPTENCSTSVGATGGEKAGEPSGNVPTSNQGAASFDTAMKVESGTTH